MSTHRRRASEFQSSVTFVFFFAWLTSATALQVLGIFAVVTLMHFVFYNVKLFLSVWRERPKPGEQS